MPDKLSTHCKHGHEYTKKNTYIRTIGPKSYRVCRRCVGDSGKKYRRGLREARGYVLPIGHPIPENEIHVTHTGIYFGNKKLFDQAYMYFDIDPVEITFEPSSVYYRELTWKSRLKPTIKNSKSYGGYIMQPLPLLRSGKIPFGIYERSGDNMLTYYLTDRPLPTWCRDGAISNNVEKSASNNKARTAAEA